MSQYSKSQMYLIGGGIASLSAAVYLIKDGGIHGSQITIFEESKKIGGSLDARDLSEGQGYSMRGIRMFEEKAYNCLFDLMSEIPSLNTPDKNLRQEFIDYNRDNKSYSKGRLIRNSEPVDGKPLKLNAHDRYNLVRLFISSESKLQDLEIQDHFTPAFFTSNFWYEFCTVFAFQPWHSLIEFRRYFFRFLQSFSHIDTLESIESSPYNQYEFLVLPLMDWLKKKGVVFMTGTKVTDLEFVAHKNTTSVSLISYEHSGTKKDITVGENDFVFTTLGSLVASSSTGSMTTPAPIARHTKDASWALWETIAPKRPGFGVPSVFNTHIDKSVWTSFTITFKDPLFFTLIDKYVHKNVTSYGGVNLVSSNWFISMVLSYKPYFVNQPDGVTLCWGYGLLSEQKGNVIQKRMSECTGAEILTELVHHLGFEEHLEHILKTSVCIPCTTPYVTSLFLPRKTTDRPLVVPHGSTNFAFLGQYCEIPHEVVFTIEHSVRAAQIAVYTLLKIPKKPSPIYKGAHHLRVIYKALLTLFR